MSVFASLGIVILAMLIMASMQLSSSVFLLFYHHALGKKSKSDVSFLTLFYFLGVEIISAVLFLSCYLLANVCFLFCTNPENTLLAWIMTGVLIALSITFFFLYFKSKKTTEIFIPHKFSETLLINTAKINKASDAFALGAMSTIGEFIFTIPLYILTSIEIIELGDKYPAADLLTILYILTPIIPIFIVYIKFRLGQNLAEIQRHRIKNINFTRFIVSLSFLTIAIIMIYFRIN